ncbi:preprotein translocase subunit SecG [Bordetella genomosp. 1]|uniref:Protein-export membrane protein SecG n=1 Tax=Bordetella genomosp. 1 TaxID=1395607 RepID=A0ABX4F047_9BORD|nr:preprotein translocase subunit SecG [Bordetella genomosp. 1]OZI65371.1 preprotein translocase subunit SecG [Bordetella genomosp. 1]
MLNVLPILMIVQVISALAIIVLVLLQQGKGADMGSSFGSGSAGSLFGASGAANFLSRTTKWAAVVFFVTTAGLAYVTHSRTGATGVDSGVMQQYQDRSIPQAPGAATSVPGTPAPNSVPSAPAQPDASVPQAPAQQAPAPAAGVPAAPAPAPAEAPKPAQ